MARGVGSSWATSLLIHLVFTQIFGWTPGGDLLKVVLNPEEDAVFSLPSW
jgi:hypothetical protein